MIEQAHTARRAIGTHPFAQAGEAGAGCRQNRLERLVRAVMAHRMKANLGGAIGAVIIGAPQFAHLFVAEFEFAVTHSPILRILFVLSII